MKKTVLAILMCSACGSAIAEGFSNRFEPLGMNYALPQWTDGDEWAMEVNYSFKYTLFNCELWAETPLLGCKSDDDVRFNFYFKYNGEFDFYADSRESGPVINRTSNPAFHLLFKLKDRKNIEWFDIGIEHRSDGQVVDANDKDTDPGSPTFGQYLTQIAYQNDNHKYFDYLSRGANYLSLSVGGKFGNGGKFSLSGKVYDSSEESYITWGELAGEDVKFKDYDLIRLNVSKAFKLDSLKFPVVTLGAEYTVGLEGFNTDSIDINLITPWRSTSGWEIPILIRAHFGPMDRLSDYTQERNSIGVGVAFSY